MKKLVQLLLLLISAIGFSQISLSRHNLTPLTDGQVVAFNTIAFPAAELDFYVKNNSTTASTNIKITCTALVNNDGTGFELCFGQCYIDLVVGQTVPPAPQFLAIAPGGITSEGNHFANTLEGTEVKDYVFRFHETDSDGNDIGSDLTFTYRYDPTLGINDFDDLDISVASTVILNDMQVSAVEELNMEIYNLQGKLVSSEKINIGQQLINMSNLSSQMYIVKFSNDEGASKTIKVVKK